MSSPRSRFLGRLVAIGNALDGAVTAARAAETGRRPPRAALVRLGIEPDAFDGVRLG